METKPANDGTITQELRPKKIEKRFRDHTIAVRVSPAEFQRIKAAADRTGEQVTAWSRRLLLRLAGDSRETSQLSLPVEARGRRAGGAR